MSGANATRSAELQRKTKETNVAVTLVIDGTGTTQISTGIPFFDHMLEQLGKHAGFDLTVAAEGDLDVDLHHTVEDTGIVIGNALQQALGDKVGVRRFANALVPLDEALVQVAVDLSGRPFLVYDVDPVAEWIGTFDPQLAEEFWKGFVDGARLTLHVRSVSGKNGHHVIEASFKGVARALARRRARRGHRRAVDQGHAVDREPRPTQALVDEIAVVDYGIGNLRSAEKALQHLGADAQLTADADAISRARAVVLPGVGNFGACMRALRDSGLEPAAKEAATDGRPFLGVCVGMQMLFEGSDESPDVAGLGVVAGRVTRLPDTVRLPQMGWNTLEIRAGSRLGAGLGPQPWCYFVHTFAPDPADDAVVAAWCEYGRRFAAAIEQGPLWATQFHPEKSSTAGLRLLTNFVEAAAAAA